MRGGARGATRAHPWNSSGILTERGVQAALEKFVERTTLPIRLELSIGMPPPVAVGTAAYLSRVSEALTNAVKHAGAMDVRITVARTRNLLAVEVSDTGIGGAASHRGSGLCGLTDRVEALGGRLTVTRPP